jgi:prepilin-type N-terminal cleavage/methylation domain-containing protein
MKSGRARSAGFTLAEIMVVIVIIAILAALLVPAVLKGSGAAKVAQAKQQIHTLGMALDSFYNDFGFYPPTNGPFNPTTGQFDGVHAYNASDNPANPVYYAYNKALVHCLCNKWTRGTGDEGVGNDITKIKGVNRIIGKAPVSNNVGPYLEVKPQDLSNRDGDGWMQFNDPWSNVYLYIPKDDYLNAAGTGYRAGALVFRGVDKTKIAINANGYPDLTALTTSSPALAEHQNRLKFQLISMGPDGWTPGLVMVGGKVDVRDLSITANPYGGAVNPAVVGSDDDMSSPLGHVAGKPDTADDINNWQ